MSIKAMTTDEIQGWKRDAQQPVNIMEWHNPYVSRVIVLELIATIEAQQQDIFQYKSSWELEKDWHGCWIKTAERLQKQIQHLQAQVEKAREALLECRHFKHDVCTDDLIHDTLSFLKAGDTT